MRFDEKTLRKLTQLALIASKVRAGCIKGERRSTKRGTSIEFADYRDYVPGDDLRRLDWNVYARLDQPFIKLLEEEEDLAVHVLIDASRSMDWGKDRANGNSGTLHKFSFALHLAAAISAIALGASDRLTVAILQEEQVHSQFGPLRSQARLLNLLSFLETINPSGKTSLNAALRSYALSIRRPGLTFILSDLFDPAGYQTGLTQLQARGDEVALLHILAPDEIDPPLAGDLCLLDIETGQMQEVSVDGSMRSLYQQRLRAWRDEVRLHCNKRGARYLELSTSQPWDRVALYDLRRAGLVK